MKDFDIEERVKNAVQNFESGYNCAQSVFLAYSDVFELDLNMAKNVCLFWRWCRPDAGSMWNGKCYGYAGRV